MVNKIDMYDKVIPKGTKVEIVFVLGTPGGTYSVAEIKPDIEGYKLCPSYLILTVPDEVQANISITNENGEIILLPDYVSNDTVILDSDDFRGLNYLDSIKLYANTITDTTADRTVTLEIGGKLIIPYL